MHLKNTRSGGCRGCGRNNNWNGSRGSQLGIPGTVNSDKLGPFTAIDKAGTPSSNISCNSIGRTLPVRSNHALPKLHPLP